MLSYKMLLNILILFLCTSCCACQDQCYEPVETFYLRPIDKLTGENLVDKYDTLEGNTYLTDEFDNQIIGARVNENAWYDSLSPYLVVSILYDENDTYKLWLKGVSLGSFSLKTKKAKRNFTACCSYNKIIDLKSEEPTIIFTRKPEEKNQPFYEVQF
ncbi:hypothetical protein ACE193_12710 [Bernardetia sp. OM2101]|uniref:hypothetical protein n=1 Tax=Bernardetia sp. OM2101 TaxID=3344876 RepID=UPI0035CFEF29